VSADEHGLKDIRNCEFDSADDVVL